MAGEAGGDGGDPRPPDGEIDSAWRVDWDAVPLARLVDSPEPRAERASEQRRAPAAAPAAPVPEVADLPAVEAAPPPEPMSRHPPRAPAPVEVAEPPDFEPPPPSRRHRGAPPDFEPAPPPRRRMGAPPDFEPAPPPRRRTGAPPDFEPAPPPRRRGPAARPDAEPAPPPRRQPPAEQRAAPRPPSDADPAAPAPPADAAAAPRARGRRGRVLGVLALSAAIAAGAYLLTRPDADAPSAARETPPAVQAPPPAPPPQPAGPPTPRRVYSQAKAFVDSGVRFRIVAHPDAPWARRIRRSDAADGRRWQFVYVLYRNLARDRLVAEDLQFRLKDGLDNVYDPLPGAGNGGSDLPPGTQIAPGRLVKGQLAFQVPRDGRSLSLIIDLKPETRARVPLGSG